MPNTMTLKYLFVAEFTDGTKHEQSQEDKSKLDPEIRSEFYDVLQSGKAIKRFSLVGNGHTVSVDLQTGLFTVDGLDLLLESEKLPTKPERFELLFYRQHTHDVSVTYDTKTGNVNDTKNTGHLIEYFIGWKAEINGKEYQQKLAVA